MKIILITGGAGTGKSTISKMIKKYPVYDMDMIGKQVLQNLATQEKIKTQLEIKSNSFEDFKTKLLDKIKIEKNNDVLKSIMHQEMVNIFLDEAKGNKLVFLDAALHKDFIKYINFYKVIKVTAPLKKRIDFIQKRNNVDAAKALTYIEISDLAQLDECDFLINNDGDLKDLEIKLNNIIKNVEFDI